MFAHDTKERGEMVRLQLPHKYECVYAWNKKNK